jgi:hypothetical protein
MVRGQTEGRSSFGEPLSVSGTHCCSFAIAVGRATSDQGYVVEAGRLAETLARAAQWIKYDVRRRKWVAADVPGLVIEAYQGRVGEWKLPVPSGVTGTPYLRRDGSLHDVPGYDPISGLLYKPEGAFDAIPERPTKDDAIANTHRGCTEWNDG